MTHRQLLRLATLTAFVFFIQASPLFAQRSRNTTLYSSDNIATGQITGKITGDAGPLSGVRVVISHTGKVVADANTGADGMYTFYDLIAGHYDISYFKTEFRKRIITQVPVVENFLTTNDIQLSPINSWKEERSPKIELYEDLKDHKIEKMK